MTTRRLILAVAVSLSLVCAALERHDVPDSSPPRGAKVLFDGTAKSLKQHWEKQDGGGDPAWRMAEGGAAEATAGSIVTKEKFDQPLRLHVEFRTPETGHGNSGVYLQGRYEVQIYNSHGVAKPQLVDCGSIYDVASPRQNASKPPGEWQTFDIEFHPPKFEGEKKVAPARMTVIHNGVKVHDNQEIKVDNTTAGMGGDPRTPGPIMLQDHGDPVQFRNVWVAPLDGRRD